MGEEERNIDQLPSVSIPTGDRTCNLDMCPDRESKLQSFGAWNDVPINRAMPARAVAHPLKQYS